MKLSLLLPALALPIATTFAQESVPGGEFSRQQLTDEFWSEGANFGDFNKDGKNDIVYGQYWWEGPAFTKRHEYYKVDKSFTVKGADGAEKTVPGYKGALSTENDYSRNFFAFTRDFNDDGWTDILILGFPGEQSWWFENPQGKEGLWKQHVALDVTENESPWFTDLTGDRVPEIVCMSKGKIGYATPDSSNPTGPFTWHPISPRVTVKNKEGKESNVFQRFTHGLGVGDVNGDGRLDILEKDGWWEQPASLDGDPEWTKHDAQFGSGGAHMFAYDVNADGNNDVITSLQAHGYGLVWFEQTNDGGVTGWTKHVIVGDKAEQNPQGIVFSQPHAIDLVDMNGDGAKDIVTGKRFWAHGPKGDNDPNGTPVLYWFELKRDGGKAKFVGHLIDDASGIGTQVVAGDINGDKKPDVVVGNKRGAFVLLRK